MGHTNATAMGENAATVGAVLRSLQSLIRPLNSKWLILLMGLMAVLASALLRGPTKSGASAGSTEPTVEVRSQAEPRVAARPVTSVVPNVTVISRGEVVWRGTVDLRETLAGILSGRTTPRAIFQNRERRLPAKPQDYYQEFVHPTPGVSGAGSQRIIRGKGGELYYTADHYQTFVSLN